MRRPEKEYLKCFFGEEIVLFKTNCAHDFEIQTAANVLLNLLRTLALKLSFLLVQEIWQLQKQSRKLPDSHRLS